MKVNKDVISKTGSLKDSVHDITYLRKDSNTTNLALNQTTTINTNNTNN